MENKKKFKIIFVLGAPGGGKNTQCDLIKEKYKIFHFSCGELLRAAVKENDPEAELINKMMKEGLIVPARITCSLQKKAMIKNSGNYDTYLCDGFPRNEENLNVFIETFKDEIQILGVLFIECPQEECARRIGLRQGQGRIDDNIESLKKRFKVMDDETVPNLENLKKYGPVFMINGNQAKEKVFEDIEKNIGSLLQKK